MQTLNKIGELTKILSVKSEIFESIMHFMAFFSIGRILSKYPLDKMCGRYMAEKILAFFDGRSTYTVDLFIHRVSGKKGDYSLSKKERSMQFLNQSTIYV